MRYQGSGYGHYGRAGGFRPPPPPQAPVGYRQQPQFLPYQLAGQQPPPAAPGGPAGPTPYDYSSDPALQRILAADAAARSNAQAAALAAEKQIAIQLGDATGILTDKNTAKEAAKNPFSTLATLKKGYGQTRFNTDESMNQSNLYYSGTRAKQMTQDAYGYQHQQYDARQAALNALATVQANLASALSGYDQADASANSDASRNAAQQSATYGYDPGAASAKGSSVAGALADTPYRQSLAASPAFRALSANRYRGAS